jgi:hypothetical protein
MSGRIIRVKAKVAGSEPAVVALKSDIVTLNLNYDFVNWSELKEPLRKP